MPINDTDKTKKSNPLRNESGFTLLEIIAVLVILSILAVVAVPKYFDLQTQAKNRAIQSALAEGIGRVNGYFARQVLAGVTPTVIDYGVTAVTDNMGDFTLTIDGDGVHSGAAGTNFTVHVSGNSGTAMNGVTASRVIRRPGGL